MERCIKLFKSKTQGEEMKKGKKKGRKKKKKGKVKGTGRYTECMKKIK